MVSEQQVVEVAAKPDSLELTPAETAVIVVDMQNHFASPGGTWANSGVDTAPVLALVEPIRKVLKASRSAGVKVVYLRMPVSGRPDTGIFPPRAFRGRGAEREQRYLDGAGGRRTGQQPADPMAASSPTWNADIVAGLTPEPDDLVITKTRFSGFYDTELHAELKRLGITTLAFTGCTTSVCVESTLRDARFREYDCLLLEDCVAEPIGSHLPRTNHDATLLLTELVLGWVTDSASFVSALDKIPIAAPAIRG